MPPLANHDLLRDTVGSFLPFQRGDQLKGKGNGAAGRGAGDHIAVGDGSSVRNHDRVAHLFLTAGVAGGAFAVGDAELGKYAWSQYGKVMQDQISGETEAFTNVLILSAKVTNEGLYHYADFEAGGTGYYANGGKLIPITWTCNGEREPFLFYTEDGQELQMGVGNTYIAILPEDGSVEY